MLAPVQKASAGSRRLQCRRLCGVHRGAMGKAAKASAKASAPSSSTRKQKLKASTGTSKQKPPKHKVRIVQVVVHHHHYHDSCGNRSTWTWKSWDPQSRWQQTAGWQWHRPGPGWYWWSEDQEPDWESIERAMRETTEGCNAWQDWNRWWLRGKARQRKLTSADLEEEQSWLHFGMI